MAEAHLFSVRGVINRIGVPAGLVIAVALMGSSARAQSSGPAEISLQQAIQLALANNPALKAARSGIAQSKAQEITAAIRPNPVFTYDDLFVPILPSEFTAENINTVTEFDLGITYTFERGHKRRSRIRAARDQTAVTSATVKDNARALTFNVAQQFLTALLAKSSLQFAQENLKSFQQTVSVSESRYQHGAISEGDLLKIKLQTLQFQTDVSQAKLALVQARDSLRSLIGYSALPENYRIVGQLTYQPVKGNLEDFQATALNLRPDLLAARAGVTASKSQYQLAKANGKRDLTTTFDYAHVGGINSASFLANIEIPIFDRNQGEIARTHAAITQAQESERAAQQTVMTDVATAYEAVKTGEHVIDLYQSGYLKQSKESRDISEYAYKRGAVNLLDFLDAERSYRTTQLAYRQALATYMLAVEQLREAAGTRQLP